MNLYQKIVEQQTELICRFKPDGTLTYVNKAYCDYFNKRREDLVGHSFMPLIPAEDQPILNASLASITPENPVTVVQHRVILDDGSTRWQEWTDTFLYDDDGNFIEGQAVGRDITGRRAIEDELWQANNTLNSFFDVTPMMMLIVDFDDNVLRINDHFNEVLGYSDVNVDDFVLAAITKPEDLPLIREVWDNLRTVSTSYSLEFSLIAKDGTLKETEWRFASDLQERKVFCVGRDVTIRNQRLRQKRIHDAQFRQIVNTIPDAIVYAKPDRTISLVNEGFTNLFGYDPKEVYGETTQFMYADPERYYQTGKREFSGNAKKRYAPSTIEFRRKNGETFSGETIGVSVVDEAGETIGLLGISRDITARIQMETELHELNRSLELRVEQRTEEIQTLVHKITHDFRAPIRAVNNYLTFLEEDCADSLDAQALGYMAAIQENANYMGRLVQDLLTYSKVRHTRDYTFAPIDLNALVRNVVLRTDANELGRVEVPETLPNVHGNAQLIEQALVNLIDNATKYVSSGKTPEITITIEETATHWGICVSDKGIGIPEQHLGKIFGMFERLHAQNEYDGTGIGLTIVHSVAEVHGGHVDVTSTVGAGSTFKFYIKKDLITHEQSN